MATPRKSLDVKLAEGKKPHRSNREIQQTTINSHKIKEKQFSMIGCHQKKLWKY